MDFQRKLPIPQEVKREFPLTEKMEQAKKNRDEVIRSVFEGQSDKFLLIIGPCSADHREPVLEYLSRLCKIQEQVSEKIVIIPRIYTNKPRTTGKGYKGIVSIRELHMAALRDYGFSCADEMLYPENHRYLSDLLSYVAMKNPTGGDLHVMINAITAAQSSHTFIYRGWEVISEGNPWAHAILRGYVDYAGKSVSNYHYEDLAIVSDLYAQSDLSNPSVIVDTNHNNSGKKYLEQVRIAKDIVHSRNQNADIKKLVKGLMVESYLEDGAQGLGEHVYGKSITDPCLGWEKTEQLIFDIADKL